MILSRTIKAAQTPKGAHENSTSNLNSGMNNFIQSRTGQNSKLP